MTTRIDRRFAELKEEGRPALVTFVTAGDPDYEHLARRSSRRCPKPAPTSSRSACRSPIRWPTGPPIQASGQRALQGGQTLVKTLAMVRAFRAGDDDTPIVLMGYYNPIYSYGNERFLDDAKAAGVDGLIVVDLPPEADDELCLPALARGLNFIRLATPTTDDKRLPAVLANTSGFVYYVSILGITGIALRRIPARSSRRCKGSSGTPYCRLRSASASRPPRRRAPSAGPPTAWWSVRPWSARSRSSLDRRRPGDRQDGGRRDRAWSPSSPRACGRRAPRRQSRRKFALSWISNVVRPKIRNFLNKREVPQNLWIKCPETGEMVFHRDLEANQFVIPGLRLPHADERQAAASSISSTAASGRPSRSPTCRSIRSSSATSAATPIGSAMRAPRPAPRCRARRRRRGRERPAGRRRPGLRFHGRLARHGGRRGDHHRPSIPPPSASGPSSLFAASGGARMQEGVLSLMQLPRTTVAVEALPRGEAPLHRRPHQPDHRRRHRLLRHARRHPHRRAGRAHRLRRPARHRADHPREAAGGLPARRVPARARHGRHGRPPPQAPRDDRPPLPAARRATGRRQPARTIAESASG